MKPINFTVIPYKKITCCAVCGTRLGKPLIILPRLPLTELFIRKKPDKPQGFADQDFHYCENCSHGQLGNIIPPEILYTSTEYFFRTSRSKTALAANNYFLSFINKIIRNRSFGTIVEPGCSDLYLLESLISKAEKLIGIDPVLSHGSRRRGKIIEFGDFFENIDLTQEISGDALSISSHTLEHIDQPGKFIEKLLTEFPNDSLHIHQFPCLNALVADGKYDQIFHQHLQYFSIRSFTHLVEKFGGEVISSEINWYHWGALMIAFRKRSGKKRKKTTRVADGISADKIRNGYLYFKEEMKHTGTKLSALEVPVYGFGAALMLPILAYHLQNDFSGFKAVLDDDKKKKGLYYINLPVQIQKPLERQVYCDSTFVVTAVNTTRSVLPRILELKPKRIIFPMNSI